MSKDEQPTFWNRWKKEHPHWHQLLVLELVGAAGLFVGLTWLQGTDWWTIWSEQRESVRDLILIFAAIIGVPFIIWREVSTHRSARAAEQQAVIAAKQAATAADRHHKQTDADRERRITDSFTKAVELLGRPELEVRLGSIYALERIARESELDHWPIMETLTAYVRTKCRIQIEYWSLRSHPADEAIWLLSESEYDVYNNAVDKYIRDHSQELSVDIEAILKVINRRTIGHEDEDNTIDLSKSNLNGIKMSSAYLKEADLSYTNLLGADLSGADLFGAHLLGTNLIGASLTNADLSTANLFKADLRGTYLRKARLVGSYLRESVLTRARMGKANLQFAILIGCNLGGAELSEANLTYADLENANLSGGFMFGANFSGAKLINAKLIRSDMMRTKLNGANLSGANLKGTNLNGADLSKAENVTQEQLNEAFGDTDTKLPLGLTIPYRLQDN